MARTKTTRKRSYPSLNHTRSNVEPPGEITQPIVTVARNQSREDATKSESDNAKSESPELQILNASSFKKRRRRSDMSRVSARKRKFVETLLELSTSLHEAAARARYIGYKL